MASLTVEVELPTAALDNLNLSDDRGFALAVSEWAQAAAAAAYGGSVNSDSGDGTNIALHSRSNVSLYVEMGLDSSAPEVLEALDMAIEHMLSCESTLRCEVAPRPLGLRDISFLQPPPPLSSTVNAALPRRRSLAHASDHVIDAYEMGQQNETLRRNDSIVGRLAERLRSAAVLISAFPNTSSTPQADMAARLRAGLLSTSLAAHAHLVHLGPAYYTYLSAAVVVIPPRQNRSRASAGPTPGDEVHLEVDEESLWAALTDVSSLEAELIRRLPSLSDVTISISTPTYAPHSPPAVPPPEMPGAPPQSPPLPPPWLTANEAQMVADISSTTNAVVTTSIGIAVGAQLVGTAMAVFGSAVGGAGAAAGGASAAGAQGGPAAGGSATGGGVLPLLMGAQRFTTSAEMGVPASNLMHGVAANLGWLSGEFSFLPADAEEDADPRSHRRLQAAAGRVAHSISSEAAVVVAAASMADRASAAGLVVGSRWLSETEPPPCMSWCAANLNPWTTKCTYTACIGCVECAPLPCASWCASNPNPRATTCTFASCTGCDECYMSPPPATPPSPSMPLSSPPPPPPPLPMPRKVRVLLNTIMTFIIAIGLTIMLHLLMVSIWRHWVNRRYYRWRLAMFGVGASSSSQRKWKGRVPKFFPYPKSLLWPTPLLFTTFAFASGITSTSVTVLSTPLPDSCGAVCSGGRAIAICALCSLLALTAFVAYDLWSFANGDPGGELLHSWRPAERAKAPTALVDPYFRLSAKLRIRQIAATRVARESSAHLRRSAQLRFPPRPARLQRTSVSVKGAVATMRAACKGARSEWLKSAASARWLSRTRPSSDDRYRMPNSPALVGRRARTSVDTPVPVGRRARTSIELARTSIGTPESVDRQSHSTSVDTPEAPSSPPPSPPQTPAVALMAAEAILAKRMAAATERMAAAEARAAEAKAAAARRESEAKVAAAGREAEAKAAATRRANDAKTLAVIQEVQANETWAVNHNRTPTSVRSRPGSAYTGGTEVCSPVTQSSWAATPPPSAAVTRPSSAAVTRAAAIATPPSSTVATRPPSAAVTRSAPIATPPSSTVVTRPSSAAVTRQATAATRPASAVNSRTTTTTITVTTTTVTTTTPTALAEALDGYHRDGDGAIEAIDDRGEPVLTTIETSVETARTSTVLVDDLTAMIREQEEAAEEAALTIQRFARGWRVRRRLAAALNIQRIARGRGVRRRLAAEVAAEREAAAVVIQTVRRRWKARSLLNMLRRAAEDEVANVPFAEIAPDIRVGSNPRSQDYIIDGKEGTYWQSKGHRWVEVSASAPRIPLGKLEIYCTRFGQSFEARRVTVQWKTGKAKPWNTLYCKQVDLPESGGWQLLLGKYEARNADCFRIEVTKCGGGEFGGVECRIAGLRVSNYHWPPPEIEDSPPPPPPQPPPGGLQPELMEYYRDYCITPPRNTWTTPTRVHPEPALPAVAAEAFLQSRLTRSQTNMEDGFVRRTARQDAERSRFHMPSRSHLRGKAKGALALPPPPVAVALPPPPVAVRTRVCLSDADYDRASSRTSFRDAHAFAADSLAARGFRDRKSGAFASVPEQDAAEPARTERLLAHPFRTRYDRSGDAFQAREGLMLFRVNGSSWFGIAFRPLLLLANIIFGFVAGITPLFPPGSSGGYALAASEMVLKLAMSALCFTVLPDADRLISRFLGTQFFLEGLTAAMLLFAAVGEAQTADSLASNATAGLDDVGMPMGSSGVAAGNWWADLRDAAFVLALSAMAVPLLQLLEQRCITPTYNVVYSHKCDALALCATFYILALKMPNLIRKLFSHLSGSSREDVEDGGGRATEFVEEAMGKCSSLAARGFAAKEVGSKQLIAPVGGKSMPSPGGATAAESNTACDTLAARRRRATTYQDDGTNADDSNADGGDDGDDGDHGFE